MPPGSACRNCETALAGAWCHASGQAGEAFHRHAHHFLFEALEGLLHTDGRLFRTLPRLFADPDGLTRDYLAGKRAAQIPPIRFYLVTLFIVFLVGGLVAPHPSFDRHTSPTEVAADIAKARANLTSTPPMLKQAADWLLDRSRLAVEDPERLLSFMHERARFRLSDAAAIGCVAPRSSAHSRAHDGAVHRQRVRVPAVACRPHSAGLARFARVILIRGAIGAEPEPRPLRC